MKGEINSVVWGTWVLGMGKRPAGGMLGGGTLEKLVIICIDKCVLLLMRSG